MIYLSIYIIGVIVFLSVLLVANYNEYCEKHPHIKEVPLEDLFDDWGICFFSWLGLIITGFVMLSDKIKIPNKNYKE